MSVSLGEVYYLQDDYAAGGLSGNTGNRISQDFTAPSLANAQSVAQIYATLFQRNVRLVGKGSAPPFTLFTASASLALSNAPSSISF